MTNFFQNLPIPKELRDALNSETSAEDGSGGVSAAPRTAKFIVGNELAGDTIAVCDFLDPGNGTGIEAALAAGVALNGPFDVWLRPGDYDLTAVGAPTLPMRLPAVDFETLTPTCSIRSNRPPPAIVADSTLAVTSGARIIVGDDRTLFAPSAGNFSVCNFDGLQFLLRAATPTTNGVVLIGSDGAGSVGGIFGSVTWCQFHIEGDSTTGADESLRYVIFLPLGDVGHCAILAGYGSVLGAHGTGVVAVYTATGTASDCVIESFRECITADKVRNNVASGFYVILAVSEASGNNVSISTEEGRGILLSGSGRVENNAISGSGLADTIGIGVAAADSIVSDNTIATAATGVAIVANAVVCVGNNIKEAFDCISVSGNNCQLSGNSFATAERGVRILAGSEDTVIGTNLYDNIDIADVEDLGFNTLQGPLLRGLRPPTSAAACPVGVVDEMRGNAAGFTVCTAVRPVAVPTSTENVWGNYNAAQLDGGWWVGVDATRWKFGCGRVSDSSVVENFSGGELTDYPPGAFLNKLFLLTIRVSGTTGELFVNDRLVSTITLTGGYQPATLGLAPMIHTNNNGAVPRLVAAVPFVAGAYAESVLTNAEIRAAYYAMQRNGAFGLIPAVPQWTSIYNVYNDPTTNGITDSLAARGTFTAVDPIGVDELRIMW